MKLVSVKIQSKKSKNLVSVTSYLANTLLTVAVLPRNLI